MKSFSVSAWLQAWRAIMQRYRIRLPLILIVAVLLALAAIFAPNLLSWEHWVLLVSHLGMLMVCVDFNLMILRVYRKRGDLHPVRHSLGLLAAFIVLITLGRLVGFASLFFNSILSVVSLLNLSSALAATVLVAKSQIVEDYALNMPKIADMQAAAEELSEAVLQLAIREKNALEGMTVLADDTIIEANPEAYQILGYDLEKQELIGMRSHQLLHEDDTLRVYQATINGKYAAPYLVRVICKDGSIKQVETTSTTIPRHGTEVRVANFRDVTYERRYLQLLGKQVADCATPNERLVQEMADLRTYFHDSTPTPIPHAQ